jgi:hypothetical protein
VEYPFTADEWEALTQRERAHRCRLLGDEALSLAEQTTLDLKPAYLDLARQWLDLAGEIESTMRRPRIGGSDP